MATEDRQFLEKTLDRVIDMVKFAETKHAVLVGLTGGAVFGVLRLYPVTRTHHVCLDIYLYIFLGLAIISVVISLLSFAPILNASLKDNLDVDDNLAYFSHASRFDGENYLRRVCEALSKNEKGQSEANLFLAQEIVVNSQIAVIKLTLFRWSLVCVLCAIATPLLAWAVWRLMRKRLTDFTSIPK